VKATGLSMTKRRRANAFRQFYHVAFLLFDLLCIMSYNQLYIAEINAYPHKEENKDAKTAYNKRSC
jgi:hypothetical protein